MKIIKLMLDYLQGPTWKTDPETGKPKTGIPRIDEDETTRRLNLQIQELYCSYYEFDSHEEACWFNEEKEKADKEKMLSLLGELIARLDELNDGSFVVEDLETPRLESL